MNTPISRNIPHGLPFSFLPVRQSLGLLGPISSTKEGETTFNVLAFGLSDLCPVSSFEKQILRHFQSLYIFTLSSIITC